MQRLMDRSDPKTALVLGAAGGLGGEVARRLMTAGWKVRALHRAPERVAETSEVRELEWIRGDALNAEDVEQAGRNAQLIVHAVNPPGYRNWSEQVLPMLNSTLAAARANRARIVLPGTVYNFGPDALPEPHVRSPQRPTTRKGALRAEMEQQLRAAADRGNARVLIVRAGDYFGPRAGSSWFSQLLVRPGRPVTRITYPGAPGVGHQWAYLPDVAEAIVQLVEREEELDDFAPFHLQGHWDPDGTQMIEAIRRALGTPDLRVRSFPWWSVRPLSPFVPFLRELAELRYLWRTPVRLGNEELVRFLGTEPKTPLDAAVRATLIGLGCMTDAAQSPSAGSSAPSRSAG